jgi:hypothetical protein
MALLLLECSRQYQQAFHLAFGNSRDIQEILREPGCAL